MQNASIHLSPTAPFLVVTHSLHVCLHIAHVVVFFFIIQCFRLLSQREAVFIQPRYYSSITVEADSHREYS